MFIIFLHGIQHYGFYVFTQNYEKAFTIDHFKKHRRHFDSISLVPFWCSLPNQIRLIFPHLLVTWLHFVTVIDANGHGESHFSLQRCSNSRRSKCTQSSCHASCRPPQHQWRWRQVDAAAAAAAGCQGWSWCDLVVGLQKEILEFGWFRSFGTSQSCSQRAPRKVGALCAGEPARSRTRAAKSRRDSLTIGLAVAQIESVRAGLKLGTQACKANSANERLPPPLHLMIQLLTSLSSPKWGPKLGFEPALLMYNKMSRLKPLQSDRIWMRLLGVLRKWWNPDWGHPGF